MIKKLERIIRDTKGDNKINVTPEMVLLSDLKLDSFDVAQLVSEIEAEFNIKVNDRDINNFKTVQNILDYIKEKQE
jgi:acyl carrier protein